MKVSCIIPTKDRRDMVLRAIASAYRQHAEWLEIVLVDDGSVDGTADAVRKRYPAVRIVELCGLGPGPARNAGVEAACGDVLMFLDSDDMWLQDHVDSLLCALRRGFSVAYGVCQTIDQVGGGSFLIPEKGMGPEGDCFHELVRWCFLVPSASAVKREAFQKVSGFAAGCLAEDWAFFLELAKIFPFGFAGSSPITVRHLHKGSLCHLTGIERIVSGLDLVRQVVLRDSNLINSEALARIGHIEQWVKEKGEAWTTVQEWYTAMREEGLV